jgi:hypothetical protein
MLLSLNVNFFLICIVGCGVQLGPLGTTAARKPIVPASGDYDDGKIGEMISRQNRSTSEKTCPSAASSTTNPTCCPDANPGRRGGRSASNRLTYGTAKLKCITGNSCLEQMNYLPRYEPQTEQLFYIWHIYINCCKWDST